MPTEAGPGRWLRLAAAPTFAAAGLYTAWAADPVAGAVCGRGAAGPHPGGMVVMYALMALFHLTPWLRLRADRWPAPVGRTGRPSPTRPEPP